GDSNKGKWDVAAVPGGAGNWGGSYLAIPKQSACTVRAAWIPVREDSAPGTLARAGDARAGNAPSVSARMAVAARLPAARRGEAVRRGEAAGRGGTARCEKDAAMCRELSEIHRPATADRVSIFSGS
ncbi:hypothetical protein AB0C32_42345, partial [Streptosporangium sp. NPDC048865]